MTVINIQRIPPHRKKGKEKKSFSFNLTATGRTLLALRAKLENKSQGDVLDDIVTDLSNLTAIQLPPKQTGPKGGHTSYFFGKNRGTVTAPTVKPVTRKVFDLICKELDISRGDLIEFLLRRE